MRRIWTTCLVLAMCVSLVIAGQPTAQATGNGLRDVVVAQTQAIMDVEWTLENRIYRTNVTGERLEAFHAGGILPTTYFEFIRLNIPHKGVPVESNPGSLEYIKTQINMENSKVPGIGHITANSYVGMDVNSFLVDVLSRVTPDVPMTLKWALTHPALKALLEEATLDAVTSKQAIGENVDAAKAAYAKLRKGDLLLAWDNEVEALQGPSVHAMVVKEVADDRVTVMYPAYSQNLWTFKCDTCGVLDTEGPSSAACPGHVLSSALYTFMGYKKHADTHPDAGCSGTWTAVNGTTWRTETVNYDALLGVGDAAVPYAGTGYLPYTLAAYTENPDAADVKVFTEASQDNIAGGFTAKVSSNYRIVGFDAVLTHESGTQRHFESVVPRWDAWQWEYSDAALDLALLESPAGKSNLTLMVKTGPVLGADKPESAWVQAYSFDFVLDTPALKLTGDKKNVVQGENMELTLTAKRAGLTAFEAELSYDPVYYTFDIDASKMTVPQIDYLDDGKGTVTVRYAGSALALDAQVARMVFKAVPAGRLPVMEGIQPFKIVKLSTATGGQLTGDRAEGVVGTTQGYTAVVYEDYAAALDLDLVLVYVYDQSIVLKSAMSMTYDGNLMHEVSDANYSVDGNRYICTFGYLTPNADVSLVSHNTQSGAVMCTELKYSSDVNQSGVVDINDAQTIMNICNGKLPLEGNEVQYLMADIDRNGRVDTADCDMLVEQLMNR